MQDASHEMTSVKFVALVHEISLMVLVVEVELAVVVARWAL